MFFNSEVQLQRICSLRERVVSARGRRLLGSAEQRYAPLVRDMLSRAERDIDCHRQSAIYLPLADVVDATHQYMAVIHTSVSKKPIYSGMVSVFSLFPIL